MIFKFIEILVHMQFLSVEIKLLLQTLGQWGALISSLPEIYDREAVNKYDS